MENTLRKCTFNPDEHLINITDYNGKESSYLEVKWRIEWFNIYCKENGIKAKIISNVQYISEARMFLASASIFMNGEEVTNDMAAEPWLFGNQSCRFSCVQNAVTAAKGRALANIGFGTTITGEKEPNPADAPMPIVTKNNEENAVSDDIFSDSDFSDMTFDADILEGNANDKPPQETPFDAAKQIMITSGAKKGKTLGDLFAEGDISTLKFYAGRYVGSNIALKEGAQCILNENGIEY